MATHEVCIWKDAGLNRYTFIMLEHLLISYPCRDCIPFFSSEGGKSAIFSTSGQKYGACLKRKRSFPNEATNAGSAKQHVGSSRSKIWFEVTSNNFFPPPLLLNPSWSSWTICAFESLNQIYETSLSMIRKNFSSLPLTFTGFVPP